MAFRSGLAELIPLKPLFFSAKLFSPSEVEILLCGGGDGNDDEEDDEENDEENDKGIEADVVEKKGRNGGGNGSGNLQSRTMTSRRWSVDQLEKAFKFDHGYTAQSEPIRFFLEILAEFKAGNRRKFLMFMTGSPRLPPSGLGSLIPQPTIVRKHLTNAAVKSCDGDLISVMTCANYIKLPPYSTKAIMRERLLFVINEGQGSFDLS